MASLFVVCMSTAVAADDGGSYALKGDAPTGSMLKRNAMSNGDLPYDRRYDQLTAAQRDVLKSGYEPMAPDDEPPFPADGRGPMMRAINKMADAMYPRGLLDIAIEVGPDGIARSAKVYHAPDDPYFTQRAAQVLMLTKWKPAVCGGQPCTMWYSVKIDFVSE